MRRTNDEKMIACCSDGTRPVIFKIERIDCRVLKTEDLKDAECSQKLKEALEKIEGVSDVKIASNKRYAEIIADGVSDEKLAAAAEKCGFKVSVIE